MTDYQGIENRLTEQLNLERRPIAITFRETPPPGVPKFTGSEPSGCSFWRLAAEGRTFYTVASDHYNCPIGSFTHNISLPPERAHELDEVLGFMTKIGYVRMEEIPAIPRLPSAPGAIIYAPLGETPLDPDVVLLSGRPGKVMLLEEAAIRARVTSQTHVLARPTCMALPAALAHGLVASTGCIGNRVYTGLDDGEMYVAIPGKDLHLVADQIQTIGAANATLFEYHRDRRQKLATD